MSRVFFPYSHYSRQKCLENRMVIVNGEVTAEMAQDICSQLLVLEAQDRNKDITMVIMSPGGSVISGLAICDTMKMISCRVVTVVVGAAYSMGAIVFFSGDYRMMTEHAKVMIHQVAGGYEGRLQDILIDVKEMEWCENQVYNIIVEASGGKLTYEEVVKLCERDKFYRAHEAQELNWCHEIVPSRKPKSIGGNL